MKNQPRWKIVAALVCLVLVVALGFFWWRKSKGQSLVAPKKGEVVEAIYGLGTVLSDKVYSVRSGLTLQIKKVLVKEGDSVKPGDLLLQMDDTLVRAPIAGTVTHIAFKEGELIPPQIPILTVTNLSTLYLEVSLEQQSVLRVQKGQRVGVSFESLRNEKVEGVVARVYPRDSQFIVRIDIEKWPVGVLPGMTADVAIQVGKKSEALLIPVKSIVAGQVTRVRSGQREKIPVRLGVVDGEWAEILGDSLTQDDRVILQGP